MTTKSATFAVLLQLSVVWQASAQEPLLVERVENGVDLPASGELFTLSQAALGALFFASLVKLEPVESSDEGVTAALSRYAHDRNAWPRWGGRELGRGAVALAVAAGPLAFGLAAGDWQARSLGIHSVESLYAGALLASLFKTVVGRARPGTSSDADVFKPFSGAAAYHSFPSDHATRVFALASTYARHLGGAAPWVPLLAYSLATWTATTRIADGAHWLTDVTAGAALGIFASRVVEWLNHRRSRRSVVSITLLPLPGERLGLGLSLGV